jgi:hypothetical protein
MKLFLLLVFLFLVPPLMAQDVFHATVGDHDVVVVAHHGLAMFVVDGVVIDRLFRVDFLMMRRPPRRPPELIFEPLTITPQGDGSSIVTDLRVDSLDPLGSLDGGNAPPGPYPPSPYPPGPILIRTIP